MVGVEVRTMATSENQSLAGEKMAIRIDAEIKSCRIFSSSVMNVFQCLFADGKEFTLSLVVPEDFANQRISDGQSRFCSPARKRST